MNRATRLPDSEGNTAPRRKIRGAALFRTLTDPRWAVALFIAAMLCIYAALPLMVYYEALRDHYLLELARLATLACIAIALGYHLPVLDWRFGARARRIRVNSQMFHGVIWGAFGLFLVTAYATADAIPLLSALQGASMSELSQQRGDFLKTRTGAEAALIYVSTVFVGALLPYSLARIFLERNRVRYLLLVIFLGYSISFLQKALFLNAVIPLLYVAARQERFGAFRFVMIAAGSIVLLYLVTTLAFGDDSAVASAMGILEGDPDYFTAAYIPANAADHLIWRSTSVPMFTAADTLAVFDQQFDGKPLAGVTSSLIAGLLSLERIPLEKLVFAYQWGWNEIGNSNAVYFTEAFVNFGWVGVALVSLFVGQSLRWLRLSRDEGLRSLWAIYCFALFSGGIMGTLFSNGYLLVFIFSLLFKLDDRQPALSRA